MIRDAGYWARRRSKVREFLRSWHGCVIFLLQCLLLLFFSRNTLFRWLNLPLTPNSLLFSFLLLSSFLPRLYMSHNGEKPNNNLDSKLKDSLHSVVRGHFYFFTSLILSFRRLKRPQTFGIKSSRYKIICNRTCAQHTAKFNLLQTVQS